MELAQWNKQWKEILQTRLLRFNLIGINCTSTAIGEQALLTSAHCVKDNLNGVIETENGNVDVKCTINSSYPQNNFADFSLCKIVKPIKRPSLGFEVVNTITSDTPKKDGDIKLLGFGCDSPSGVDHTFGQLREGDATVLSVFSEYLVAGGGANACLGDSGGGAYASIVKDGIKRRLVAVTSSSDLNDFSFLLITAKPVFITWAQNWSKDQKIEICGLNKTARNCHQ